MFPPERVAVMRFKKLESWSWRPFETDRGFEDFRMFAQLGHRAEGFGRRGGGARRQGGGKQDR
jgi:hypothetical protein